MKLALVAILLLLTACATTKQTVTVTVTTKEGRTYQADPVKPLDPRTHADGTRMDWVELAVVKVNGGLPPTAKPAPQWACMAADAGTTGVALSTGLLAEANPLGIWVAPYSVGVTLWARHREKIGDPVPAQWNARVHCVAAVWNMAMILMVLL